VGMAQGLFFFLLKTGNSSVMQQYVLKNWQSKIGNAWSAAMFDDVGVRDLCLVGYRIMQAADAFDRHFDGIARDDRSDALGSAGCDQVTRFECHDLRDVTNEDVERENKISRVAGLAHLAIDAGFDLDAGPGVNINAVGDQRSNRAEGIETFAANPLRFFFLQIAGGEIIDAGVAKNVGANVITVGKTMAAARDYYS